MDKAIDIASMIFELVGKKNPKKLAEDILNSGKAEKKLREIIAEQGGDEKVQPEDINIGKYKLDVYSKNSGVVLWINNVSFANLARFAGAPKDKGAGIVLYKKVGDNVKEKEKLFTVYAEAERKLEKIDKFLEMDSPMGIGDRMEMLIYEIKEAPIHEKIFLLER
jgi:AMP phosphorylase